MIEKILELLYTIRAFSAKRIWGCSSPGRAIRSQRIGSQFESDHLHHAKRVPKRVPFLRGGDIRKIRAPCLFA